MPIGYLLTTSAVAAPDDARAVVEFVAGPWSQLIALPLEHPFGEFPSFRSVILSRLPVERPGDALQLVALSPIPLPGPRVPKIGEPPEADDLVAYVLAKIAPGSFAAFVEGLSADVVSAAIPLAVPYSHVLLELTDPDPESLSDRLSRVLDNERVVDVQLGLALGSGVSYPLGPPAG
jgi:hypothetical protein